MSVTMKNVTIATDDKTAHQAIYVDGDLMTSDSSIYASEINNYVDSTDAVRIESITVDLQGDSYPEQASELVILWDVSDNRERN